MLHTSAKRVIQRWGSSMNGSTGTNLYVRNCATRWNGSSGSAPVGCFGNNHYVQSSSWGTEMIPMLGGTTLGEEAHTWIEPSADDFTPAGILRGRLVHAGDVCVPFDVFGRAVTTGGAIGAVQVSTGPEIVVRADGLLRDSGDTVDLGTVQVGGSDSWSIMVRNNGGATLTITTPTSVSGDFSLLSDVADATLEPTQEETITIALDDQS